MNGSDRAAWIRRISLIVASFLFVAVPLRHYSIILAGASDFRTIYSSARCLMTGCNPYLSTDIKQAFIEKNGRDNGESAIGSDAWRPFNANYPPTALALVIPFSALKWKFAVSAWCGLISLLFIAAVVCMVELCVPYSTLLVPSLLAIFLATSNMLIVTEQPSGIAIALCVLGVWTLLKNRSVTAGIVCFALSLTLKPQVGALVLIYFLLATRLYRRRALAIVALAAVFCLPGLVVAAMHSQAAHWIRDLSTNLHGISMHGNLSDPGPANLDSYMIANLQTVIGVFQDDARFENHLTWLICGGLFALWTYITVRAKGSDAKDLLGIASIAAMSLLPMYHRHYDARLLVLTFPAMALLSARRDVIAAVTVVSATALIVLSHPDRILPQRYLELTTLATIDRGHLLLAYHSLPLLLAFLTCFYTACYARLLRGSSAENLHSIHVNERESIEGS
jgi:hypothetical protein